MTEKGGCMTPEHPKPDPLAELCEWYRSNCAGWDDVEDIEAELDREPLDDEGEERQDGREGVMDARMTERHMALIDHAVAEAEATETRVDLSAAEARALLTAARAHMVGEDAAKAERALRRAEARAAVVVWGLAVADWRVWRVDQRWVFHVPFGALETDPVLTCPRLTDSPLADVTPEVVDAIAATPGCPETLRVGWEGVRDAG